MSLLLARYGLILLFAVNLVLCATLWRVARTARRRSKALSDIARQREEEILHSDALLIANVIARGFEPNQDAYISWVGIRLNAISTSAQKSKEWARLLNVVGFAGSGLSSVITGVGIFGVLTIPASFVVTSIGTFALGVLTLLSLGDRGTRLTLLADNIRLELAQLLASCEEYSLEATLSAEFLLFASQISKLLGDDSQQEARDAKRALEATTKNDGQKSEQSETAKT